MKKEITWIRIGRGYRNESGNISWRLWDLHQRGKPFKAQVHDRDRRGGPGGVGIPREGRGGWLKDQRGYMVLEPGIFAYLKDDRTVFEQETIQLLVADGVLCAYQHDGFWQCMDTRLAKFRF